MSATLRERSNSAGITIVEVMISLVVLSMTVILAASILRLLIRSNSASVEVSTVASVAESKIEDYRNMNFVDIPTGTTTFSNSLPSSLPHPRSATATITTPRSGVKKINVTVSAGDTTRAYATYVSEHGVDEL